MSASLVGAMTLGVLNPVTLSAIVPAEAQLNAQLTGALALQASVSVTPPSLSVQLAALLKAVAQLQAGIALGLPGVSFSVSAAATLVATIEAEIALLSVLVGLLSGTVFVYKYSGGTVSTIGSDLSSAITSTPPPGLVAGSPVTGLLLGAGAGAWPVVSPYFGGIV